MIDYNHEVNGNLSVRDLDRAIDWYMNVLGFSLQQRMDQIGFAILRTPVDGVVLSLSRSDDGAGPGGVTMTWGVSDIEAAESALKSQNANIEGPVRDIPEVVRLLTFFDPDGNRHQFWSPPTSRVEDKQALLAHYRQMREELLAAIDGLTDDQMTDRTIDGWSVKDHLLHLSLWDEMRALEVERISAGHDSALRMKQEQEEGYNATGYALRRDMSLEQARWELEKTRERLLAAIASATPRGLDGSLYGESALRSTHEAQHAGWIKRWRSGKQY